MGARNKTGHPEPFGREKLARLAHIMGPQSGAQKALENFDDRVKRGIPTDCYVFAGRVIVGDPIHELPADIESFGGGRAAR